MAHHAGRSTSNHRVCERCERTAMAYGDNGTTAERAFKGEKQNISGYCKSHVGAMGRKDGGLIYGSHTKWYLL